MDSLETLARRHRTAVKTAALVAAARRQHDDDSLEKDAQIETHAPLFDIAPIQCHSAGIVDVIAAANLPKSRETGPGAHVSLDQTAIFGGFGQYDWAGTDDTHLAPDDVPQLRQLVEAGLSQHQ